MWHSKCKVQFKHNLIQPILREAHVDVGASEAGQWVSLPRTDHSNRKERKTTKTMCNLLEGQEMKRKSMSMQNVS